MTRALLGSHDGADHATIQDAIAGRSANLVDSANFLIATRDTGYKTTALAVAELIDNSLQADADRVAVDVSAGADAEYPIVLSVSDNGSGMDTATLAAALSFGGSTRFDDRSSLGRYGMGLPNGTLSRARRVEVYTWQGSAVRMMGLDVDELIVSRSPVLPPIKEAAHPPFSPASPSGTVVRLLRCDRLEYRTVPTIVRKLTGELGRIYRRFLVGGVEMTVNNEPVKAVDPLMLDDPRGSLGACQFGDVLLYRLEAAEGEGVIKVRFSELPIERWYDLPVREKRLLGVTGAPTVSVLRASREIDRGWFFMGSKRRENYDDWWRCEVDFEPVLDESFGLTHSKQAVVPSRELLKLLSDDLEGIGRALNSRVRRRFARLKVSAPLSAAEKQAARADESLPRLPDDSDPMPLEAKRILAAADAGPERDDPYRIIITELDSTSAFQTVVHRGRLVVALNSRHPFYRDLYEPLAVSKKPDDRNTATLIALTVLAAARAERLTTANTGHCNGEHFWMAWSDVLASFFNSRH